MQEQMQKPTSCVAEEVRMVERAVYGWGGYQRRRPECDRDNQL